MLKSQKQNLKLHLESCSGSVQNLTESCVNVLVTSFKDTILAECAGMIRLNETEKLHMMFKLLDRVTKGIEPMLAVLEAHIYQVRNLRVSCFYLYFHGWYIHSHNLNVAPSKINLN